MFDVKSIDRNPDRPAADLSTLTPRPPAQSSLTVCPGQEPNSLYPFGELNSAARSVLAAVYDGPFDTIAYEYQPVILTKMPSFENGDAQVDRIQVQAGDTVLGADGNLVTLKEEVRVRPAGCRADDCVIPYNGTAPLEMDQMLVTFHLRPDLTWSDGTPLTADDSIFSFELHKEADIDSFLLERTQVYEAADEQTLQWFGVPGFIDPTYFTNFWMPAPRHAWSVFPADELPSIDIAANAPLGWGPYMVEEWSWRPHCAGEESALLPRGGWIPQNGQDQLPLHPGPGHGSVRIDRGPL
ncbi:MAG: hypothetical protein HND47_05465 [Chloroflexi bacterium]|nr:hypothetical protein [Chloroflexota bacterium]